MNEQTVIKCHLSATINGTKAFANYMGEHAVDTNQLRAGSRTMRCEEGEEALGKCVYLGGSHVFLYGTPGGKLELNFALGGIPYYAILDTPFIEGKVYQPTLLGDAIAIYIHNDAASLNARIGEHEKHIFTINGYGTEELTLVPKSNKPSTGVEAPDFFSLAHAT